MKVITVESPQGKYEVPLGTRILWDTTTPPTNWQFDTLDGLWVMGADEPDLTHRGATTHTHTTPGLASAGAHSDHPVTVSDVSGVSANIPLDGGAYNYVGGHSHSGTGTCTSAGAHTHTTPNTGTASNYPPFIRLKYIYSNTSTIVPVGGIVIHNGSPTALGTGWQVCNGTNGTYDLRGLFPMHTSGTVGTTGGVSSHSHTVGVSGGASATHSHTINILLNTINGSAQTRYLANETPCSDTHNHTAGCTSPAAGAHTHSINNTGTTDSLPPYIQLYFIKRIA
jgi:hypothetical protein